MEIEGRYEQWRARRLETRRDDELELPLLYRRCGSILSLSLVHSFDAALLVAGFIHRVVSLASPLDLPTTTTTPSRSAQTALGGCDRTVRVAPLTHSLILLLPSQPPHHPRSQSLFLRLDSTPPLASRLLTYHVVVR